VTKSASHLPCQCTCLRPMADSFSRTTVRSFLDVEAPRPRVTGGSRDGVPGPASKVAEGGSWVVEPVAFPGCLKMPKLMDFLCGWTLHDMVCPEETLTHLTRYDWHQSASTTWDGGRGRNILCCAPRCSPFRPWLASGAPMACVSRCGVVECGKASCK
jgi:hypothetical protein